MNFQFVTSHLINKHN